MLNRHSASAPTLPPDSPAASIGQHLRWQIVLTLAGILVLATLLGYSGYSVKTTLVPDRGGVFREGVVGFPRYFNPLLCQATEVDQDLCTLLYRGLTKFDKHGRVVPDLASHWMITDEKIYTFHLNPEQYWHDGQLVTADDVLFTIGVLQDPNLVSLPDLTSLWRTVQVEKLDDFTVRFSLTEPFARFLDYTTTGLLPKHIWQNVPAQQLATMPLDSKPIGNGPMRVDQLEVDHIRLEPSPFVLNAKPYLAALEMHFYPDQETIFTAYTNGEIDGIGRISSQDLPEATKRQDLQLFSAVEPEYYSIVFNLNNPNTTFLQDKVVRQALYYGLDRQSLIDEAAAGQGIIAHTPLLPENWAYLPNVQRYDYDPDTARQLLESAGWVDGDGDGIRDKEGRPLRFLLYSSDEALQQALIERISADWKAIGVDARPLPVKFAGLVTDFLNPRLFDAALISWKLVGDPDPYPLWHSTQATGGGQNYSGWSNEEADQIMEEARATINEEKRKELFARFQRIFAEEAPALLLYYPVYTYGVSDRVHNVQIGSLNKPSERFDTFGDWYILTRRVPENQVPTAAPPTPPGAQTQANP